jgi:outer membrane protein OmpA-like peptidoglycan-associated protein
VGKYGIEPSRLQAKVYGPTRPVADNKKAAGRLKSRRAVAVVETMVQN